MIDNTTHSAEVGGTAFVKPGEEFERRETHAAVVYLVGDRAYKIKKAVKLPYLDFSTRDKRLAALRRELEINRLWAPSIYLGLTERNGEPALEMRRFDEGLMLTEIVRRNELTDAVSERLAGAIADAHRLAPLCIVNGIEKVEKLVSQIASAFASSPGIFGERAAQEFRSHANRELEQHNELFTRRATAGFVRRCHGDLHCYNIIIEHGQPMLFDAIEFSEEIATIDVLYDLAFLLMDLLRLGQLRAANIIMNQYFDLMRDREDLSGIALLPLFLAIRAGVRALVAADHAHELPESERGPKVNEARAYMADCMRYLVPREPLLVAIGGLSGTGKSTLARSIAPVVGPPPGAIVIRSDVERKRAAGIALTARFPAAAYSAETSRRVYDLLKTRASTALAAQHTVITDAVYAAPAERDEIKRVAKRCGSRFVGLWLQSPGSVMQERVAARTGDASDATPDVVSKQMDYDLGTLTWSKIDASGSPAAVLESARQAIKSAN